MENITKAQFLALDIDNQIKYLNDRLQSGQTVIRIREDIGIGEKGLQKIIKENGYKYNQKERLYKPSTTVETKPSTEENKSFYSSSTAVEQTPNDELYKTSTDVEKTKYVANIDVENEFYDSRGLVVSKDQFDLMFKSFKEIEKMNAKLEKVYQWYEKENEVIDVTPLELKIDKFEGDAVARAYKFYPEVQKDFIEFCNKHKQYKTQDIISQALKEFMEKYRK
ncbi:MAG: hypothetical protein ACRCXT_01760 [Paraclostridium sp.]